MLISNSFLAFVWLPRKWRKTFYDSTIKAWSHTHLQIQHMICKTHKFHNENSTTPNIPRSWPTSHQHILQIQNQLRNPFVERNSVKYEPSWLVIPVISAILWVWRRRFVVDCRFGSGIVVCTTLLLRSFDLGSEGKMCIREGERGTSVNWRWWYERFNSGLKSGWTVPQLLEVSKYFHHFFSYFYYFFYIVNLRFFFFV